MKLLWLVPILLIAGCDTLPTEPAVITNKSINIKSNIITKPLDGPIRGKCMDCEPWVIYIPDTSNVLK